MGRKIHVNVTLLEGARAEPVLASARSLGFTLEEHLQTIGVLRGSVDEAVLPQLEAVEGIETVERDRDVGIPPPGSPVQ